MEASVRDVISYLPEKAAEEIAALSLSRQADLREIRIKADGALLLTFGDGRQFVDRIRFRREDVEASYRMVCGSSVYSHRREIREGYVTLRGGHRVGILGSAVLGEDGKIEGIRDVGGLVFRITRDPSVDVSALKSRILTPSRIRNLMIVGPPGSGKTTVLRALARELSRSVQLAVIDERGELFPPARSCPEGCDLLRGYPKASGILQALRILGPQIVVCDEIGSEEEVCAMGDGLRCGVGLLCTAHAYTGEELFSRPPVRRLISLGGVDLVAFLDERQAGKVKKITERKEFIAENIDASDDFSVLSGDRPSIRCRSGVPPAEN